ncbi:MAG: lysophospholipid acyltransferase family protein [Crocinitomicaceae bacterium]
MIAIFSILKLLVLAIWSFLSIMSATLLYFLSFQKKIMLVLAKYMWAKPILLVFGARIKVTGLENIEKGQHYLIMANHTSYSDIPVLFSKMPFYIHFIAKQELRKVPFLGWYMDLAGMIFIDRQNKAKSRESIDAAGELIKAGKSVVIFPEGTTSKTGEIGPFKKGGMHLALASESLILPIRITGTRKIWPSKSFTNLRWGKVEVIIDKPIPYAAYQHADLDEFVLDLRQKIVDLA